MATRPHHHKPTVRDRRHRPRSKARSSSVVLANTRTVGPLESASGLGYTKAYRADLLVIGEAVLGTAVIQFIALMTIFVRAMRVFSESPTLPTPVPSRRFTHT